VSLQWPLRAPECCWGGGREPVDGLWTAQETDPSTLSLSMLGLLAPAPTPLLLAATCDVEAAAPERLLRVLLPARYSTSDQRPLAFTQSAFTQSAFTQSAFT